MKPFSNLYRTALPLLVACALWSCQKSDPTGGGASGDLVEVGVRIGADNVIEARAFSDDDPLSVDRILVIPYIRSDDAPDLDANYTADPGSAVQMDVADFSSEVEVTLLLSPAVTYKLVVFGYTQAGFDFVNNGTSGDLMIDYGYPQTLENLTIQDNATTAGSAATTEIYYDIVEAFKPGTGAWPTATLTRMVGGLSITLTYVPDDVEMRLYHTSPMITMWYVAQGRFTGTWNTNIIGTGYYTLTNAGGNVHTYSRFYFPAIASTPIIMEIEAVDVSAAPTETSIARVPVATADYTAGFTLAANDAINLSGDYREIILGQEFFTVEPLDDIINLDDDLWDGLDGQPEI